MPARRIAVSIFLILLLVAAVRAQDQKPPSFTNPEDDSDPRMRIESDTWVLPFPGVEIRVTYLEAGTHSVFLEERAPDIVDPFTPDGLFPGEYYLFRIDLTNRSDQNITFHPGNVMIITNKKGRELPLEYSDFYRRLMHDAGTSPERWLKRWVEVYWDGSNTLYPGDTSSKLIAFRSPSNKWKRMQLYISALQIGADTHHFGFPFQRKKGEKTRPVPPPEKSDDDETS